jgi:hypothetical protein
MPALPECQAATKKNNSGQNRVQLKDRPLQIAGNLILRPMPRQIVPAFNMGTTHKISFSPSLTN